MRWLALIFFGLWGGIAPGVIVDRVAISVGGKIITASELDARIELTAFQNHEKPDFSLASRQKTAQQLIDQKLIEREMDVGRYPRLDAERKEALLAAYAKADYKADPAAMAQALTGWGLTAQDLEDDLGRQSDLLTFLNLRFRPAVQVTDRDVQKYFETAVKGAGKAAQQAQTGALDEIRDAIEQKLTAERANKELDLWLADQRKRTKIVYLDKALEPGKDLEPGKALEPGK
ncbi:MAG: SurA N-terminal domain-containing protein [Acidobacteriota bacterium]|nr:SurA N-terminal domain-containing protein [Acidobacteriota bacterium]